MSIWEILALALRLADNCMPYLCPHCGRGLHPNYIDLGGRCCK